MDFKGLRYIATSGLLISSDTLYTLGLLYIRDILLMIFGLLGFHDTFNGFGLLNNYDTFRMPGLLDILDTLLSCGLLIHLDTFPILVY